MSAPRKFLSFLFVACVLLVSAVAPASAQDQEDLKHCEGFAYSTEEEFVTQGPEPADGNPIISDGDLLSRDGVVCARNRRLLF